MNTEERIKALEDEIQVTGKELRHILLDIRCFLAEVHSPLRGRSEFSEEPYSHNEAGKGAE